MGKVEGGGENVQTSSCTVSPEDIMYTFMSITDNTALQADSLPLNQWSSPEIEIYISKSIKSLQESKKFSNHT